MGRTDINFRYRQCAIHCLVHGCKNDGRKLISWDELRERFGIAWESYAHELMVKGMLHFSSGYVYLSREWVAMTRAEGMEAIRKMYPKRYV